MKKLLIAISILLNLFLFQHSYNQIGSVEYNSLNQLPFSNEIKIPSGAVAKVLYVPSDFMKEEKSEQFISKLIDDASKMGFTMTIHITGSNSSFQELITTNKYYVYDPNNYFDFKSINKSDSQAIFSNPNSTQYLSSNILDSDAYASIHPLMPEYFLQNRIQLELHGLGNLNLEDIKNKNFQISFIAPSQSMRMDLSAYLEANYPLFHLEDPYYDSLSFDIFNNKASYIFIIGVLFIDFILFFVFLTSSRKKEIAILKLYGYSATNIAKEIIMPLLVSIGCVSIVLSIVYAFYHSLSHWSYLLTLFKANLFIVLVELILFTLLYLISIVIIKKSSNATNLKSNKSSSAIVYTNYLLKLALSILMLLTLGKVITDNNANENLKHALSAFPDESLELKTIMSIGLSHEKEFEGYMYKKAIYFNNFDSSLARLKNDNIGGQISFIDTDIANSNFILVNENYLDFANQQKNDYQPLRIESDASILYKKKYHDSDIKDYCPKSLECDYVELEDDRDLPNFFISGPESYTNDTVFIAIKDYNTIKGFNVVMNAYVVDAQIFDDFLQQDFAAETEYNLQDQDAGKAYLDYTINMNTKVNIFKITSIVVLLLYSSYLSIKLLLMWLGHIFAYRTLFGYSHLRKYKELYLASCISYLISIGIAAIIQSNKYISLILIGILTLIFIIELFMIIIVSKRNDRRNTLTNLKA